MSSPDSSWPEFQSDVAASRSWARSVSSGQRRELSLTHSELIQLVNQLAGHVKELSSKLDSQQSGIESSQLEQYREEIRSQQEDIVQYVQAFSAQFGVLQQSLQVQIQESRQLVQNDVSQVAERQVRTEAEVVRLRSEGAEQGVGLNADEAARLRGELLAEVTHARHLAQESHQVAEKAIHRASLAANSNDALQAEFDEAQVQVERRCELVNNVCKHLEARINSTGEQLNERIDETVHETIERLTHLDAVAAAQETRRRTSISATSARLHELELRLAQFEGLEPLVEPSQKRNGPPQTWQFERRNNDRQSS